MLLNLIVAVKLAVLHFTPSGDVPLLKSMSLPAMPFQEVAIIEPLGTAHMSVTIDPNVTFIETGTSENTALLPAGRESGRRHVCYIRLYEPLLTF